MRDSSGDNTGTQMSKAVQGLKRVWSAPTITDEDASLTAALKPIVNPVEGGAPTTPQGPS